MGVSCNLGIMNFDQYNISADKGTGINDIITAYVLGNWLMDIYMVCVVDDHTKVQFWKVFCIETEIASLI